MLKVIFLFLFWTSFGSSYLVRTSTPEDSVVVLLKRDVPVCTGACVGKSSSHIVVVTAAHCVYSSENDIKIKYGSSSVPVDVVIVHPHYTPPSPDFDIAIIKYKIETPLSPPTTTYTSSSTTTSPSPTTTSTSPSTTTSLSPPNNTPVIINLIEEAPANGSSVQIFNWNPKNGKLEIEEGKMESKRTCKLKYEGLVAVSSRMICANVVKSIKVYGGSPLISDGKLAGVSSNAYNTTLPKIYMSVADQYLKSFIKKYL